MQFLEEAHFLSIRWPEARLLARQDRMRGRSSLGVSKRGRMERGAIYLKPKSATAAIDRDVTNRDPARSRTKHQKGEPRGEWGWHTRDTDRSTDGLDVPIAFDSKTDSSQLAGRAAAEGATRGARASRRRDGETDDRLTLRRGGQRWWGRWRALAALARGLGGLGAPRWGLGRPYARPQWPGPATSSPRKP